MVAIGYLRLCIVDAMIYFPFLGRNEDLFTGSVNSIAGGLVEPKRLA